SRTDMSSPMNAWKPPCSRSRACLSQNGRMLPRSSASAPEARRESWAWGASGAGAAAQAQAASATAPSRARGVVIGPNHGRPGARAQPAPAHRDLFALPPRRPKHFRPVRGQTPPGAFGNPAAPPRNPMQLHVLDIGIIVGYFVAVVTIGLWVSRKGSKDLDGYFLGGKTLPWYMLGVSDASGMFDISGTMYLVYALFIYGLKSIWLPWVWPTFNQIFLMMF